ncbi:MAG: hypothetical protein ABIO24_01975, partial [Saprospiraceae bacterium]
MKLNWLYDKFLQVCNALIFVLSVPVALWILYHLPRILTVQKPLEGYTFLAFLTLAYSSFVAWKTGHWLYRPKPETAWNYLWYWLGAVVIFLLILFMTA